MPITIRAVEPDDVAAIQRIHSCDKVVAGTLRLPHESVDFWRRRLTDNSPGVYSLVACDGDEVIGQIALVTYQNRRRHAGHIGMAVHDDHHRRGVGKALLREAIRMSDGWLNLRRLELSVFVDNDAAIALYKTHGFVEEGRLVDYAFRDGAFVDVIAMARINPNARKH